MFQALNSNGTVFLLTCLKISWWGLSKKIVVIKYEIPDRCSCAPYFERWDELIKTQKPLR